MRAFSPLKRSVIFRAVFFRPETGPLISHYHHRHPLEFLLWTEPQRSVQARQHKGDGDFTPDSVWLTKIARGDARSSLTFGGQNGESVNKLGFTSGALFSTTLWTLKNAEPISELRSETSPRFLPGRARSTAVIAFALISGL